MIKRHLIETPDGPIEIQPVTFCHEGGGPHRACPACLAVVESNGDLVHAAQCGAFVRVAEPMTTPVAVPTARPFEGHHLVTDGVIHMSDPDDVRRAVATHEGRLRLLREQLAWLDGRPNMSLVPAAADGWTRDPAIGCGRCAALGVMREDGTVRCDAHWREDVAAMDRSR